MNNKTIISAIICATILACTIAIFYAPVALVGKAGTTTEHFLDKAAALVGAFFGNKTTIHITGETLTVSPISEVALAKQTVRMTDVHKRSWLKSEVLIVAEQLFVVKYGYDSQDVFKIIRSGDNIDIPNPKILSVEPTDGAPKLLSTANGWWNTASPEDILEISKRMKEKVRDDEQVKDFQVMIKNLIRQQLDALKKQIDEIPRTTTNPS